jgi:hypothetical protein
MAGWWMRRDLPISDMSWIEMPRRGRHGLNRFRYKGSTGMKRWVGLGVLADNLINIGCVIEKQSRR